MKHIISVILLLLLVACAPTLTPEPQAAVVTRVITATTQIVSPTTTPEPTNRVTPTPIPTATRENTPTLVPTATRVVAGISQNIETIYVVNVSTFPGAKKVNNLGNGLIAVFNIEYTNEHSFIRMEPDGTLYAVMDGMPPEVTLSKGGANRPYMDVEGNKDIMGSFGYEFTIKVKTENKKLGDTRNGMNSWLSITSFGIALEHPTAEQLSWPYQNVAGLALMTEDKIPYLQLYTINESNQSRPVPLASTPMEFRLDQENDVRLELLSVDGKPTVRAFQKVAVRPGGEPQWILLQQAVLAYPIQNITLGAVRAGGIYAGRTTANYGKVETWTKNWRIFKINQ